MCAAANEQHSYHSKPIIYLPLMIGIISMHYTYVYLAHFY